jgi:tetratricopeptide (TPR) repeat protein
LFHKDDVEASLAELERAAALESENPETPLYRSKLYIQLNEDEKALRLAIDALESSLDQLGKSQEQMQGQMQSQGFYGVMSSETTRQDTETLDRLSGEAFDWFTDTFRESDVTPLLNRLLEQYPLSARLYSMTGNYHKEKGNRNQALQYLEEAVRLAPSLGDAHYHLGELYQEAGDDTKAIRSYRRASSLSSDWSQPYRALIDIHRKTGGLDDLCDRWLAMYRATPNNEILRSHLIEALHKANRIDEASEIVRDYSRE